MVKTSWLSIWLIAQQQEGEWLPGNKPNFKTADNSTHKTNYNLARGHATLYI